jgi:hypothetical protein
VSVCINECQRKVRTFIFSFRHELHAIADLVLLAERKVLPESIESTISTEFVAPRPQNIPYISATVNTSGKTHQSLTCCAPILPFDGLDPTHWPRQMKNPPNGLIELQASRGSQIPPLSGLLDASSEAFDSRLTGHDILTLENA